MVKALITEDSVTVESALNRIHEANKMIATVNQLHPKGIFSKRFFGKTSSQEDPDEKSMGQTFLTSVISAELSLLTSGIYFRSGSYLKGSYHLVRSWKVYENSNKILEQHPFLREQKDGISLLQFGMGLFYFFISLVPRKFLWIVQTIGFEANRSEGIRLLEECHEQRECCSPTALLLLIWIYRFFIENMEKTSSLLNDAISEYPTGVMFLYLGGYYYR